MSWKAVKLKGSSIKIYALDIATNKIAGKV